MKITGFGLSIEIDETQKKVFGKKYNNYIDISYPDIEIKTLGDLRFVISTSLDIPIECIYFVKNKEICLFTEKRIHESYILFIKQKICSKHP